MDRIPDGSVDMILSDLPYGTTACKWDSVIPLAPLWTQYRRIAKSNAAIVLTASQPFTSALVMSNLRAFKVEWIWEKNNGSNFASTKYMPMKEHESVLVFSYGRPTYNPIYQPRSESGRSRSLYPINPSNTGKRKVYRIIDSDEATNRNPSARVPRSIQKFNTEVGLHPTQKPSALFEYMIRTYSNPREIVLDNAIGSGTTAIAAINTDRHYIGFEKDPEYFATAQRRIDQHKPQLRLAI